MVPADVMEKFSLQSASGPNFEIATVSSGGPNSGSVCKVLSSGLTSAACFQCLQSIATLLGAPTVFASIACLATFLDVSKLPDDDPCASVPLGILPLAQQAVNKLADDDDPSNVLGSGGVPFHITGSSKLAGNDPSNILGSSDAPFHTTVSSVADSLVACSNSVDGVNLTGLQSGVLPSVGSVAPMVSRPTNASYHFQLAGCA